MADEISISTSKGKVYVNGKTIAKAKLKDLLSLKPSDIGKFSKSQSKALEKRLYAAAQRRLNTVYKQGLRSYAAEKYFGAERPSKPSGSSSIYALKHRVTVLKEFLNAKTSTAAGIKKVFKEEEIRIFGKNGLGFQSEEERQRFWNAYMEFMHQNPRFYDQSSRVQQFLGRESFWRNRTFTASDLNRIVTEMDVDITGGVDIRADVGYRPEI